MESSFRTDRKASLVPFETDVRANPRSASTSESQSGRSSANPKTNVTSSMDMFMDLSCLLVTKRIHRIDTGGAPCGKISCRKSDRGQHSRCRQESQRIGCADSNQNAGQD